jgi:hypothetical protein
MVLVTPHKCAYRPDGRGAGRRTRILRCASVSVRVPPAPPPDKTSKCPEMSGPSGQKSHAKSAYHYSNTKSMLSLGTVFCFFQRQSKSGCGFWPCLSQKWFTPNERN